MKTDKLAYLWLQEMPEGFFALIGRNKADALRYEFRSVEIKELSARLDAVLIPKQPDITYFVEFQFQRDSDFYARFFAQTLVYLKQHRITKWRAVVVYPTRGAEQESQEGYEELLAETRTRRIYLDELPRVAELESAVGAFKLVIEPEHHAIASARELIERAPEKLDFIEKVLFYKFKSLTRKEILKMLGIREEFEEELKKTRAYQEILEEGREEGKRLGLEEGRKEGRKEGLEQGLQQGLAQGALKAKLEMAPLLRELGLSDEAIAARLNVPLETIKNAQ